jgi:thiol:disulfide interchange protein DsbD
VISPDLSRPLVALPLLFGAGVLTSLTPCIYPMIPITVALVGGESAGSRSRWRPFALTISYAIGLALVYALLGLAAGLSGTLFGTVSTNPWLLFAMGNLLLLFALVMLDALPVPVPQSWLERASRVGAKGGVGGAFGMGAASGVVAAPCGAPVMAAVLTWVGSTRSATLGFVYLFVFSFGMTALLIVVGTFSGALARLPKAGAWMVWVKRLFALIMIGAAEYYFVSMGQVLL